MLHRPFAPGSLGRELGSKLKSSDAADAVCQASSCHQSQSPSKMQERYRRAGRHAHHTTHQSAGGLERPSLLNSGTRVPSLPSSRTPPCPLLPPIGFFSPAAISALTPSLPLVSSVPPSLLLQSPHLSPSTAERVDSYLPQGQKTQFTMATNGSTYALSQGHKDVSIPRQRKEAFDAVVRVSLTDL